MTLSSLSRIKQAFFASALLIPAGVCLPAQGQGIIYFNTIPSLNSPATLVRANGDGSAAQTIPLSLPSALYPTASRDGRRLLITSPDPGRPFKMSNNVFAIDLTNGGMAKVTNFEDLVTQNGASVNVELGQLTSGNGLYRISYPWHKAFSPDGSQVAFINLRREGEVSQSLPFPGGTPNDLVAASGRYPVVDVNSVSSGLPTGGYLYQGIARDGLNQGGDGMDWHPSRNEIIATISADIAATGTGGRTSAEGTILVVFRSFNFGADPFIRKLTSPTAQIDASFNPVRSTAVIPHDYAPAISPDGTKVAFVRHHLRQDSAFDGAGIAPLPSICALHTINYDGTGDREILVMGTGKWVTKVSWSPDGTKLAFDLAPQAVVSNWNSQTGVVQQSEIHVVNSDGSNPHRVLAAPAAFPAWAPGSLSVTPVTLPKMQITRASNGTDLLLQIDGLASGASAILEGSANLKDWVNPTTITGTGSRLTYSVTPSSTFPVGYYRVRLP